MFVIYSTAGGSRSIRNFMSIFGDLSEYKLIIHCIKSPAEQS